MFSQILQFVAALAIKLVVMWHSIELLGYEFLALLFKV